MVVRYRGDSLVAVDLQIPVPVIFKVIIGVRPVPEPLGIAATVIDAEHLVAAVIYIVQHVHVPEDGAPDVQMAPSRKARDISVLVVGDGTGQVPEAVIDPKVVVPDVVPCTDEPVERVVAILNAFFYRPVAFLDGCTQNLSKNVAWR